MTHAATARSVRGLALPLSLAALLAVPALAPAATGPADCAGYTWRDNASGCSTAVPAFGPGATTVPGLTDVVGPIPLGFAMPWYGRVVTGVWIAFDGYVTFSDQGRATTRTTALPSGNAPDDMLAAYWSSMAVEADVTYEATAGSFHVRWILNIDGANTSEIHLFLDPSGTLRVVWTQVDSTFTLLLATVGHEDATGACGRTLYRESASEGGFPEPASGRSFCVESPILLDCSAPTLVRCADVAPSSLPAALASQASIYSCSPEILSGNERVFQLQLATLQSVTVSIDDPGLALLHLGDTCAEGDCRQRAAASSIDLPALIPGTHTFVVDKAAAGGGDTFDFTVTCEDPYVPVACDSTTPGVTSGSSSLFDVHGCSPTTLDGPESLFLLDLPAPDTVSVTLRGAPADLWVVLYDQATFESGGVACLAAGRGGAGLFDAPAGRYVIVVDGEAGASGAFDLDVRCGRQLTDCSAAPSVSCATTVSGDTSLTPDQVAVYDCNGRALSGGESIYRFFNPIEQTITARFTSSQPGQRLMLLPSCDEGDCFLSGDEGLSCALFPPGEYIVVVDGEDGFDGPFEFEILCSEFLAGVDLRVTSIDASGLTGDCDDFAVSGTARVTVTNIGRQEAPAGFDVILFEDTVVNGVFDSPGDQELGRVSLAAPLPAGETVFLDVPAAGTLAFRDNVLYAMADPGNLVPETVEDNNLFDTGRGCEYRPPVGSFELTVEWAWDSSTVEPTMVDVDTVPLVGDVNGDGMPDIVINTAPANGGNRQPAVVRAISGDGSGEHWTATDPMARVWGRSQLAMADLDADGFLEVVGQSSNDTNRLVAIDHDGSFWWMSEPFIGMNFDPIDFGGGGPSIADIDCDGQPEIIFGHNVFNADGTHFWTPEPGGRIGLNVGTFGAHCPLSVAADVNGDGRLEVIAGPTVYEWNPATGMGEILWNNLEVPDGHPAIGNFDGDDLPEIALATHPGGNGPGTVYLLEGDTGAIVWQRTLPCGGGGTPGCAACTRGPSGGPPTVADFDGDCAAEVGIAGADWYFVLETNGTLKWQAPICDTSSHRTASSVFDFEGDGAAEVAFMDQRLLHVFRGTDGSEIVSHPVSSHTWIEMLAIADVDADNNAEIIIPLNRGGQSPTPKSGVEIIGDADDNWVNTRRIWNQHQYHISHVNDDGSVPGPADGCQEPSWRVHNTFRDQIGTAQFSAADITISIIDREILVDQDCFRQLRLVARVGNGGGINVGQSIFASFWDGDPADPGSQVLASEILPDLWPGEFRDVEITVPFPRVGESTIWALADDDGFGGGFVNECREDNNACSVIVDSGPLAIPPPEPVPNTALRATGHGDPHAADITADFDWSRDLLRDLGLGQEQEHYHVLRGTSPRALLPVAAIEPYLQTAWTDSTPRADSLPFVHYYVVRAADGCEQEERESP